MDENNREPFQQRWERLRQDLDDSKPEETRRFRFSLLTFLIATTATGALIGWAVSARGTDEGSRCQRSVGDLLYRVDDSFSLGYGR